MAAAVVLVWGPAVAAAEEEEVEEVEEGKEEKEARNPESGRGELWVRIQEEGSYRYPL